MRKLRAIFSAAIRSPATKDPYERKLLGFLKRITTVTLTSGNANAATIAIIAIDVVVPSSLMMSSGSCC